MVLIYITWLTWGGSKLIHSSFWCDNNVLVTYLPCLRGGGIRTGSDLIRRPNPHTNRPIYIHQYLCTYAYAYGYAHAIPSPPGKASRCPPQSAPGGAARGVEAGLAGGRRREEAEGEEEEEEEGEGRHGRRKGGREGRWDGEVGEKRR